MQMKKTAAGCVLAVLFSACSGLAAAKNPAHLGTFMYSNFCVSPMSGDLYGTRITLRRLADGDMLVYEYTDGSTHALMAEKLALDDAGAVRFEIHDRAGNAAVTGKFSADGSALRARGLLLDDPDHVTALQRVTDLAAPVAKCQKKE